MSDLKPCPFCGGEASISKDYDADGSGAFYAVKCHRCRAKSSEFYAVETCSILFAQVRDAWNTRYKPKAEELFDQQISDYVKRGKP